MTDGELPPHVKHFFNAYARGFTQSCTAQARTASLAAALGKGGFLVKDFLVRLSPPCLFPLTQPHPITPPPRPFRAQDQVSSELKAVDPTTSAPNDAVVMRYLTQSGQAFEKANFTYFPRSNFRCSASQPSPGLALAPHPTSPRRPLP